MALIAWLVAIPWMRDSVTTHVESGFAREIEIAWPDPLDASGAYNLELDAIRRPILQQIDLPLSTESISVFETGPDTFEVAFGINPDATRYAYRIAVIDGKLDVETVDADTRGFVPTVLPADRLAASIESEINEWLVRNQARLITATLKNDALQMNLEIVA